MHRRPNFQLPMEHRPTFNCQWDTADPMKTQDLKSYISLRDEIQLLASEFNLSVVRISHYENYKQLETLIITNNSFKDSTTNSIIHISGTHGVEGVAGAGVQISILQNYGKEISESKFGVMFVFALNPFGFHFRRRTSIENIDLNRNCGDGLDSTQRKWAHFFISPLINANTKLKSILFWPLAILGIPIVGFNELFKAVIEGQDCYQEGLFYTGKQTAIEIKNLLRYLAPLLSNKQKIFALDFHTGLGQAENEELFDVSQHPKGSLSHIFNAPISIPGEATQSYRGSGLLSDRLNQAFPQIDWTFIIQEIGVKSTANSFFSLIRENAFHRMNFKTLDEQSYLNHPEKLDFLYTYFPREIEKQKKLFEMGARRFIEIFKVERGDVPRVVASL